MTHDNHKFLRGSLFVAPFLFAIFVLLAPSFVFAYAPETTHQHLTRKAAELFDKQFTDPSSPPLGKGRSGSSALTQEEINWLAEGAVDEDTPPRWLNHFYDPITGEGWNGEGVATMNAETVRALSSIGLSYNNAVTAKQWAQDSALQFSYLMYEGDQSWQKAISSYVAGNKKAAFIALGHTLHLLEDMTVPEHTRNDTHLGLAGDPASPYETAAKSYRISSTNDIKIADFDNLDGYFDVLANYSNKNFVSENSINKYPLPNPISEQNNGGLFFVYTTDELGKKYPVYFYQILSRGQDYKYSIQNETILSAYWSRLAPKAVGAGAGVIKLFFKEVENARKNPDKYKTSAVVAMLTNIKQGRLPVISVFGEMARINRIGESVIAFIKNLYSGTLAEDTQSPSVPVEASTATPPPLASLPRAATVVSAPVVITPPPPSALAPLASSRSERVGGENNSATETQSPQIENINPPAPPLDKGGGNSSLPFQKGDEEGFLSLPMSSDPPPAESPPVYVPPLTHMGPATESSPPPDTTPPEKPTITAPSSDSSYLTNQTHINLAGEKSADTAEIVLSIDDASQSITSFISGAAWAKEIDLVEGEHQIIVKAKDAVGNVSKAVTFKIVVDITPPEKPTITSPTAEASWTTDQTQITLGGKKSEDSAFIILYIDDIKETLTDFPSATEWSKELNLLVGEHQVSVKAKDVVGNVSEVTGIKIIINQTLPDTPPSDAPTSTPDEIPSLPPPDTTPPEKPTITSPTAEASWITNQNQVNLSGTKSEDTAEMILSIDGMLESIAVFTSATTWSKDLNLPAGEHQIAITAKDAAGNASDAVGIKIMVDQSAPIVSFTNFSAAQKTKDFQITWQGNDDAGIKFYDLDWMDVSTTTVWQSLASSTAITSINFSGEDKHAYNFRLRATDMVGNISDWLESGTTTISIPHIVISEVQIGGATATDEFVELYNPGDSPASITGWKLQKITGSGKTEENLLTSFPSAQIPAHGFYLITHPTDYTGLVSPDALYSTKNSLAANNSLVLYDSSVQIVDKLGFGNVAEFEGAPTSGLSSSGGSLERKASVASTAESMTAGGSDELAGNGEDTDNNAADFILRATPEPQNSESAPEPRNGDQAVPGRINDLRAALVETTTSSVKLLWSTPTDANIGGNAIYEIRYLSQPLPTGCTLQILWSTASRVVPNPVPQSEGATESLAILGLSANTYYCFGVKTWNGYRWSDISNLLVVKTLKTGGTISAQPTAATISARATPFPPAVAGVVTLSPENNPYWINGVANVKLGEKLIILPGVIIKFVQLQRYSQFPAYLVVSGDLVAEGTAENPIIFTSIKDDRFGGDTDGDGGANAPTALDWGNVSLEGNASAVALKYVNFYYGGSFVGAAFGALHSGGTREISVENCVFENDYTGIAIKDFSCWTGANAMPTILMTIKNSVFKNNSNMGISSECGRFDVSGSTFTGNSVGFRVNYIRGDLGTLWNNNFFGNKTYGVQNAGDYNDSGKPSNVILDARENWWGDASGPRHVSNLGGTGDKVSDKIDFSAWSSEKF